MSKNAIWLSFLYIKLVHWFQPLIFSVLNLQKISSLLELLILAECIVLKSNFYKNPESLSQNM